jgi:hypothetical protein
MDEATSEDDRGQELHDDDGEDGIEGPARPGRSRDHCCTQPEVQGDDEHADGDKDDRAAAGSASFRAGHVG